MRAARPRLLALLALCTALLAACGDDDEDSTTTSASAGECAEVEAPAPKDEKFRHPEPVLKRGEPAIATVETSCGSFVIELDTKGSPKTANSFAFLAEEGFYDGTIFHRIAPGFVIQGGDPQGTGTGGPGYSVTEPPPEDTTYARGLVAMAKTAVEPPGTLRQPVLRRDRAGGRRAAARLRRPRPGHRGHGRGRGDRRLGDPATEKPLQTVTIDSIAISEG